MGLRLFGSLGILALVFSFLLHKAKTASGMHGLKKTAFQSLYNRSSILVSVSSVHCEANLRESGISQHQALRFRLFGSSTHIAMHQK
jgi:hypothetical protein